MILHDSVTARGWNEASSGSAAHRRGRRIACMQTGTQSRWMHTCTGGISACLRFEASSARAACVIKSHSQRAVYPPRLWGSWRWQGMHTQRHMHKHNLHAWRNAQSAEQTLTFGYMKQRCSVSLLISVRLTFCALLTFWHWCMARHNNIKEGFALLYGLFHLRTVVWALPHSDFFFLLPLCLNDSRGFHTQGPSKPQGFERFWKKTKNKKMNIRGTGVRWVCERMTEGRNLMRHLELRCCAEVWWVRVCIRVCIGACASCIWNPAG